MTYDQLVILDSVVKTGSFKAASKKLHKSQPALSVAIKKLEEEFQIGIFDRSGYRPKLTETGKLFYERAQLALHQMNSLQFFGEELAVGAEAEITVGIEGIVPITKLTCQFHKFFELHSSTNLNLSVDYLSGTIEKISDEKVDLGFTPLFNELPQLESIKIMEVKMIPVIRKKKLPLTKQTKLLKNFPQIVIPDSGTKADFSIGVLSGSRRWRVPDFETSAKIIRDGVAWGSLPEYLVEKDLKNGKLASFETVTNKSISVSIYMVRKKGRAHGPIAKKLWAYFVDHF